MYAVIMAGGVGTRFWPRSRQKRPKQFLSIFDSRTMVQATVDRLSPLIPREKTYFVLNPQQKAILQEQLPEIPEQNIILEPFGKNTAPCIGLAAIHLSRIDPDAIMAVLPSDHLIQNEEVFREALQVAGQIAAEKDALVTIGITPDRPATGYGYVQHNEKVMEKNGISVHRVKTFAEKPNYETAVRFLQSGDFLWNSGMFIWKVSTILRELQTHLPEMHSGLMHLQKFIGTERYERELSKFYRQIRSISIDYGVMEKAQNVYVVKCDFGWNDVGSWEEVYKLAEKDRNGNAIVGNGLAMGSKNSYIYSDNELIALLGVEDLIVVKADNAILVCHRDRAQEVKDLVEYLKRKEMDNYL